MPENASQQRQLLVKQCCDGLDKLALTLSEEAINKLVDFIYLIEKWNKTHNLTAIKSKQEMLSKHLLDSLSAAKTLSLLLAKQAPTARVLDVGTGAGLPGIPLALAFPKAYFTLLDSSYKRVAFLHEAKRVLGLTNIHPVHSRVETFLTSKDSVEAETLLFDVVTSRAYSSLQTFLVQTGHLVNDAGCWLALKGVYPEDEIAQITTHCKLESAQSVEVPGLQADRHLLVIRKKSI